MPKSSLSQRSTISCAGRLKPEVRSLRRDARALPEKAARRPCCDLKCTKDNVEGFVFAHLPEFVNKKHLGPRGSRERKGNSNTNPQIAEAAEKRIAKLERIPPAYRAPEDQSAPEKRTSSSGRLVPPSGTRAATAVGGALRLAPRQQSSCGASASQPRGAPTQRWPSSSRFSPCRRRRSPCRARDTRCGCEHRCAPPTTPRTCWPRPRRCAPRRARCRAR